MQLDTPLLKMSACERRSQRHMFNGENARVEKDNCLSADTIDADGKQACNLVDMRAVAMSSLLYTEPGPKRGDKRHSKRTAKNKQKQRSQGRRPELNAYKGPSMLAKWRTTMLQKSTKQFGLKEHRFVAGKVVKQRHAASVICIAGPTRTNGGVPVHAARANKKNDQSDRSRNFARRNEPLDIFKDAAKSSSVDHQFAHLLSLYRLQELSAREMSDCISPESEPRPGENTHRSFCEVAVSHTAAADECPEEGDVGDGVRQTMQAILDAIEAETNQSSAASVVLTRCTAAASDTSGVQVMTTSGRVTIKLRTIPSATTRSLCTVEPIQHVFHQRDELRFDQHACLIDWQLTYDARQRDALLAVMDDDSAPASARGAAGKQTGSVGCDVSRDTKPAMKSHRGGVRQNQTTLRKRRRTKKLSPKLSARATAAEVRGEEDVEREGTDDGAVATVTGAMGRKRCRVQSSAPSSTATALEGATQRGSSSTTTTTTTTSDSGDDDGGKRHVASSSAAAGGNERARRKRKTKCLSSGRRAKRGSSTMVGEGREGEAAGQELQKVDSSVDESVSTSTSNKQVDSSEQPTATGRYKY